MDRDPKVLAAGPRVFVHVRGAVVRLGLRVVLEALEGIEFACNDTQTYAEFSAWAPVDLLITDVLVAQWVLGSLPTARWPKCVMLVSMGAAPADMVGLWPDRVCGLVSLEDDRDAIQAMLLQALRCAVSGGVCEGVATCPVPASLRPT